MSQETSDFILGSVILVVFLVVCYFVGRALSAFQDARRAGRLAPFAPVIQGTVNRADPSLVGTYRGRTVRVMMSPGDNMGSGDTVFHINSFHIDVPNLPGKVNWYIEFRPSGMLGQGPRHPLVTTRDAALKERLERSGILEQVAAVSAPTENYVTVAYDRALERLRYTDDVAPDQVPSREQFERQLALADRLAALNEQVNPA